MQDFEFDELPDWVTEGNIEHNEDAEKFLSVLNEEQREAVVHEGGPLLILAGAGSGKTRVITTKIAYLIAVKHIKPSQILAVTFTKKAANEMKERAVALEPNAEYSQIRTFHSFGSWFLRVYSDAAGLASNFTVYDDDDSKKLLAKAYDDFAKEQKEKEHKDIEKLTKEQLKRFSHKIALCKDYFIRPDDSKIIEIENDPKFQLAYELYEKRLRETGNVDFGDLIMLPTLVLESNSEVRRTLHNRFRVIMVDEYQDTNIAQFRLLQALSGVQDGSGTYVCVVGDDDQSIYKFRGAEVQNILTFDKTFPGTKIIRLEKNYRSTNQILALANDVVSNNEGRLGKTLVSQKGDGLTPKMIFFGNQDEEAKFCSDVIEKAYEKGVPYSDWAILYRTNAQSLVFESTFTRARIPYTVVGTLKFYEREEIKDLIALLQLIANPKNEIAFRRMINKPVRGLGEKTQDKIVDYARADIEATGEMKSLVDSCRELVPEHVEGTAGSVELSKKAGEGVKDFCRAFDDCVSLLEKPVASVGEPACAEPCRSKPVEATNEDTSRASVSEATGRKNLSILIEALYEKTGLLEHYKTEDEIASTSKLENMQELANSGVLYPCTFDGLTDFLDHIELDRTLDLENEDENPDSVTFITLHNTKGLEYQRVILTGMENGIFPRNPDDAGEIEEERRLCYVGITRAKKQIYFTSCAVRRMYNRINPMMPSVFLKEMNKDNVEIKGQVPYSFGGSASFGGFGYHGGLQGYGANGLSNPHPSEDDDPLRKKWKKGATVYHDDYGSGVIIDTEVSDDGDLVVKVAFETGGTKKFFPKYNKDLMISNY